MKVGIVVHNDIDLDVRVSNQRSILTSSNIEICVLCTGNSKKEDDEPCIQRVNISSPKYKFFYISNSTTRFFNDFWTKRIGNFFKQNRVDILHVHDLFMAIPAVEAAKDLDIPIVLDLHENYPAAFRKYSWTKKFPHRLFVRSEYWDEVESTIIEKVNGLVVLDEVYIEHLKRKLNSQHFPISYCIYPNVPDLNQFKPGLNSESTAKDGVFRIFYFGIISAPRYLHIAKKAVQIINQSGKKARLVIAGNIIHGDQRYIKENVLGEHTDHIPWIDLSDLGKHIASMDVCISPIEKNAQHESGVANKVFQYMYFSKPLLVSNCDPQKRLVESTQCGLAYRYDDPQELANKISWMIDHPKETFEMGKNGRKAIVEKYNTETFGKEILKLYDAVASKNSESS
jgi:glycosyltransferase involved in cell wall biosynthesis